MSHNKHVSRKDFFNISSLFLALPLLGFTKRVIKTFVPPPILWHGDTHLPFISLTFDDCYIYSYLRKLEDILDQYPAIKVTFFPTGTAITNTEEQDQGFWNRILEKGHEIGYHGYNHQFPSKLSNPEMLGDFDKWMEAAANALGRKPQVRFARPPYGDLSISFQNLCIKRNLVVAMWSTYWGGNPEEAHQSIDEMRSGDIALFHIDYWDIENAQYAFPRIAEKSFHAVTLSNLYFFSTFPIHTGLTKSGSKLPFFTICLDGKCLR